MTATHLIQRPLRGSRISTFYPVKSLPSLASLDSAFQLQEYISLLIRLDVHDVDSIVSLPGTSLKDKEREQEREKEGGAGADESGRSEVQVDQACWIYEQLRRLAQDLSHPLITTLQQECNRQTCPEMKAGEWLYLCVAHGNDGSMEQCCAIDYILHTVDSATALLNSPRTFPSRLQIPQTSHRHFSSLARRLGRIFAHAYFSHREAFEQAEAESSLYARFLALTAKFDLVPPEFLVIPVGHEHEHEETEEHEGEHQRGMHQPQGQMYAPNQTQPLHIHQQHVPGRSGIAPKNPHLQQQLGLGPGGAGRTRSPNPPGLLNVSSSSTSAPTSSSSPGPSNGSSDRNSHSPLPRGRNRTDTMIFADLEASGVVDELVAKVKAGEFDFSGETEKKAEGDGSPTKEEEPTTAKASEHQLGQGEDDEVEDMDLEAHVETSSTAAVESQEAEKEADAASTEEHPSEEKDGGTEIEISLDPEEEIPAEEASEAAAVAVSNDAAAIEDAATVEESPSTVPTEDSVSSSSAAGPSDAQPPSVTAEVKEEKHDSEDESSEDEGDEEEEEEGDGDGDGDDLGIEPVDQAEFDIVDDSVVKVELKDATDEADADNHGKEKKDDSPVVTGDEKTEMKEPEDTLKIEESKEASESS